MVSSVCFYWRNTLLTTSSIWTGLNGKGIEKTRVWVRRSKALPIQLEVEGSPDLQVLKFLAPYFPRLDVVTLSCLKARDRSLVTHGHLAKLLRPNALLRILHIEASGLGTLDTPVTVGGEFPSLEKLFIMDIRIVLANLRAPNLRDVFLSEKFDLTSLLDFLETSPLLEYVALELGRLQDVSVGIRRKIVLEKMKRLHLFYSGLEVLQHLSLPPGGEVKTIEEMPPDQLDGITGDCAQLLFRALENLPMSRQAESLLFRTTDRCRVLLEGSNGSFELVTNDIDVLAARVTLLRSITQYSTGTIRDFEILRFGLSPTDYQPVSDFLRLLEGLQTIVTFQANASTWLSALGTNICPQLLDLSFYHPSPESVDYRAITRFVKGRSKSGVPVQQLTVVNPFQYHLNVEEVETLRKYVKGVAWM